MVSQRLPPPRNLGQAMDGAPTLASLLAGHRKANDCFQRIRPALPTAMHTLVRPGPIAEGCWTLFAENASIAAKLRQMLPTLLELAAMREPGITELKVKIQPRQA